MDIATVAVSHLSKLHGRNARWIAKVQCFFCFVVMTRWPDAVLTFLMRHLRFQIKTDVEPKVLGFLFECKVRDI